MNMILCFFMAEWNHVVDSFFNQKEYELKSQIERLEKEYHVTESEYLWLLLEEKRMLLARIQESKRISSEDDVR